jgi:hypothetical protein
VTLGRLFAEDCGTGIAQIWAMNSFNGPDAEAVPGGAGHSDILPPEDCQPDQYDGEVIAPVSGTVVRSRLDRYDLYLPSRTYLAGSEDALRFAGIESPDVAEVKRMGIKLAHVDIQEGRVVKGSNIGDLIYMQNVPKNPWKIAIHVAFTYKGVYYKLSPNLFQQDVEWICPPVNNGCTPIPLFYGTR